jgi:hypothetical protein
VILLPQSQGAGITGMSHHTWLQITLKRNTCAVLKMYEVNGKNVHSLLYAMPDFLKDSPTESSQN